MDELPAMQHPSVPMPRSSTVRAVLVAALQTSLVVGVAAQCSNAWVSPLPIPGVSGYVNVVKQWDPDGAGPSGPVWVVGGGFTIAGTQSIQNLAAWNPATSTWSAVGGGVNGEVKALTVHFNRIVVGGSFTSCGGNPIPYLV